MKEANIKYRREEGLYELYDDKTEQGYWLKAKGGIELIRQTNHNKNGDMCFLKIHIELSSKKRRDKTLSKLKELAEKNNTMVYDFFKFNREFVCYICEADKFRHRLINIKLKKIYNIFEELAVWGKKNDIRMAINIDEFILNSQYKLNTFEVEGSENDTN